MEKGVLVASDSHMEWLLPWWWARYSSSNTLPVVFIDFGMTADKLQWCRQRGKVISLVKGSYCKSFSKEAEEIYGSSNFRIREAWFKKPSACLLTPFEKALWLDLDCEVLGCLDSVFDFLIDGKELVISYDHEEKVVCNSGVIVFRKGSDLMQKWQKKALEESDRYLGDECILSTLLDDSLETVALLPELYNWRISRGIPVYAKIIHWKGEWGKQYIVKCGGLKGTLEGLPELKKVFDV